MEQHDIDSMLAELDAPPGEPRRSSEDVLDLTEQMAAPAEAETPSFQTIDGQADVVFADAPSAARAAVPRWPSRRGSRRPRPARRTAC